MPAGRCLPGFACVSGAAVAIGAVSVSAQSAAKLATEARTLRPSASVVRDRTPRTREHQATARRTPRYGDRVAVSRQSWQRKEPQSASAGAIRRPQEMQPSTRATITRVSGARRTRERLESGRRCTERRSPPGPSFLLRAFRPPCAFAPLRAPVVPGQQDDDRDDLETAEPHQPDRDSLRGVGERVEGAHRAGESESRPDATDRPARGRSIGSARRAPDERPDRSRGAASSR
jgi:hypothetical protein